MPQYTVTDPTTNKSVDLEGDSPPSEQELNQIFSQVHGDTQQQPQDGGFLSNVAQNAKDIGSGLNRVAKGITDLPSDTYDTAKGMMNGKSFSDTPIGQDVQTVGKATLNALPHGVNDPAAGGSYRIEPGSIFRQYQDIAAQPLKLIPGQIGATMKQAYPDDPFYKRPLDTAMALAPVAKPLLGAAREIPGVGSTIDSATQSIGEGLQGQAQNFGRRALGYQKRFLNKSESALPQANEAAQVALDQGVITNPITHPFSSGPADMLERANTLEDKAGQGIGSFLKSQGQSFDANKAISELEQLKNQYPPDDAVLNKIQSAQDIIQKTSDKFQGNIPFEEANKLKTYLQKKGINWATDQANQEVGKQVAGTFRSSIDQQLSDLADKLGNKPGYNEFQNNKSMFGNANRMQKALLNKQGGEAGNLPISPYSMLTGGAAMASGSGSIKAALVGLGTEWVKRYGSATAATMANDLSKVFLGNPQKYSSLIESALSKGGGTINALENALQHEPDLQVIYPNQQSGKSQIFKPNEIPPKAAQAPQKKYLDDEKVAREYLNKANGNKQMARQMAQADGWTVV